MISCVPENALIHYFTYLWSLSLHSHLLGYFPKTLSDLTLGLLQLYHITHLLSCSTYSSHKHTRQPPTSGPLHLLFLLPGHPLHFFSSTYLPLVPP